MTSIIRFQSHQFFRQRLLLSTLSGRPIRIDQIRSDDDNPGLRGMLANIQCYIIYS
jgi:RNA 3'-terminal phosphate cyclase-like protein